MEFFKSGINQIIKMWLNNGCQESQKICLKSLKVNTEEDNSYIKKMLFNNKECILNCYCHRDYSRKSDIKIEYCNSLEKQYTVIVIKI